jgi:acyl carrier protein
MAELGVDSLDALRIMAAIEKKYRIEVPEEDMGQVRTVADIAQMVAAVI